MILTVDIGNTAIKAAAFDADEICSHWRFESSADAVEDAVREIVGFGPTMAGCAVCGVVPSLMQQMTGSLATALHFAPLVVTSIMKTPVTNGYANPQQLGVDRLVNAVGALKKHGAPAIIVSVGTAVTVDVLDAEKVLRGGAIWAGPQIVTRALSEGTAALSHVQLAAPSGAIGSSTEEGLRAGILYGLAGGVDRLIEEARHEIGTELPVIATGGAAHHLIGLSTFVSTVHPDLAMIGLKMIYEQTSGG